MHNALTKARHEQDERLMINNSLRQQKEGKELLQFSNYTDRKLFKTNRNM